MDSSLSEDLVLKARTFARIVYADWRDGELLDRAERAVREIEDRKDTKEEIMVAYLRDSLTEELGTIEDIRATFGEHIAELLEK